jgi:hypothetical protein
MNPMKTPWSLVPNFEQTPGAFFFSTARISTRLMKFWQVSFELIQLGNWE